MVLKNSRQKIGFDTVSTATLFEMRSDIAPARTHLDHVLGLSVVVVAACYLHAPVLHRQKVDLRIIL